MTRRLFVISYRWILTVLVVVAIVVQLVQTLAADPPGSVVDFFSFFTVEANIVAVVAFAIGAVPGREPESRWYDLGRGAVTTYMSITGVIYATLLSDLPTGAGSTTPWVNEVLHYLMPLVVFLDWLYVPPKHVISLRESLAWVAFPLAYAAYTLGRGAAVHWYPYPLLDVDLHGYGGVIVNCVGVGVGTLVFVTAIAWLGNAMRNGRTPRTVQKSTSPPEPDMADRPVGPSGYDGDLTGKSDGARADR